MIIKLEDKKEMKDLVNKNVISWNKDIDQNPKLAKRKKKLNKLSDKDGVSDDAQTHRHTEGNQGNQKQMGNKKAETNHDKWYKGRKMKYNLQETFITVKIKQEVTAQEMINTDEDKIKQDGVREVSIS